MGIIEFKDVSFQYPNGFSAVENVSFEINEGEAIAIIGQNGAGKTTTVKMINGLLKPTHGTVLIDGMDTKDYTTAQLSKIAGYVFQNPDDQIFHNNVDDEIRFGPKKQGLSEEEIVKKTEWAAKLCGLSEQMQENPYNLPLSIRKFVSIASVLAMDDKILILDEPTAGLDPKERAYFRNIIAEMSKDKIIIISTHIVSDIEYISDQVLIMKKGKFILQGPADELLKEVKNEVWSCRVPNNQWSNFERTHCIANSHVMKEVIEARVISTSSPIEGAIIVEPTLEDLYLKLFSDELQEG